MDSIAGIGVCMYIDLRVMKLVIFWYRSILVECVFQHVIVYLDLCMIQVINNAFSITRMRDN